MRIACPSCAATYEVPASRLKPGKSVRCARCRAEWVPPGETDTDPATGQPVDHNQQDATETSTSIGGPDIGSSSPQPTAMDRLAAAPARVKPNARLIGAWVLTFAVLAAAIGAAVGWRDTIVRAWPPSAYILAAGGHTTPQPAPIAGKKAE